MIGVGLKPIYDKELNSLAIYSFPATIAKVETSRVLKKSLMQQIYQKLEFF